jgi:hypothetical protein
VNKGSLPAPPTGLGSRELLYYLLSDSSDKLGRGSPMVQMSVDWVEDRAKRENLGSITKEFYIVNQNKYVRRTVLVTFEATGAVDHGEALVDINMGIPEANVHVHTQHGLMKEWGAADIDAVVEARNEAHMKKTAGQRQSSPTDDKSKSTKTKKGKNTS